MNIDYKVYESMIHKLLNMIRMFNLNIRYSLDIHLFDHHSSN